MITDARKAVTDEMILLVGENCICEIVSVMNEIEKLCKELHKFCGLLY